MRLHHGDIIRMVGDNTRLWVVFYVHKNLPYYIDTDKPGLTAFGGCWYGGKRSYRSYGKLAPLPSPKEYYKVGNVFRRDNRSST